ASRVHASVTGSHSSAFRTAPVESSNPAALLPPVTRTLPSGRSVAVCCRRAKDIEGTMRQAGLGRERSMTSALALGRTEGVMLGLIGLPPTISTLPLSYITEEP